MENDLNKNIKEIAAALWAIRDEIEQLNTQLEKITFRSENYGGRTIYGIRTLDLSD